jgi:predicted nucleic acid-binding protein
LFSCLISGKAKYKVMFEQGLFCTLDYALAEIQEHQDVLLEKAKLTIEELRQFTLDVFSLVTVVPNFIVSTGSYVEAYRWCKDVDEDDAPYIALAIELGIKFISRDDRLVEGLRKKGFQGIISFKEFIEKEA